MSEQLRRLQQAIRQSGQRLTPQRLMVLAALAEHHGHLSAEDIYEQIRPRYPYLNLSTVYRTLELLVELGLAAQTDLGGGVREFELVGTERHHHLICQRCGGTTEIADDVLRPIRSRLLDDHGFEARIDHFAIFGVCQACRAEPERPTSLTSEDPIGR